MSNETKNKMTDNENLSNWLKYTYTVIMCFNQMSFGLSYNTFGPAIVDLKYLLNTSMSWLSLIITFLMLGYLSGSLFGFLYKYLNRQITLVILLLLMGISTAITPYSENLWTLYSCFWLIGLSAGAWNNANNVWITEMWEHNSSPILQLSNFMFGIGAILGPVIDKPYVTGKHQFDLNQTLILNTTHLNNLNKTDIFNSTSLETINTLFMIEDSDRRSKLKTAFLISGILQIIGPVLMAMMFVMKPYRTPSKTSTKDTINTPTKLFESQKSSRTLIIVLLSIIISSSCIAERVVTQFGATYFQYIPLKLTASKSAEIVSAMALSYTISRGISTLIAIKIRAQHMIAYNFLILITGTIILIFSQNCLTLLWIGSLVISFGFGPMFAAIFAFTGEYLILTDRIGTILIFFSAFGYLFVPFIVGIYIENHSVIFVLMVALNISISFIVFITILFIIRQNKNNKIDN